MIKKFSHFLAVLALLTSPVFAGYSDAQAPADSGTVAMGADQSKAKGGEDGLAADHHCCTSHAHYGESAPAQAQAPAPVPAARKGRLPLIAEEFLAAFEPTPLLEPPARA
jgi:hypothetical protein